MSILKLPKSDVASIDHPDIKINFFSRGERAKVFRYRSLNWRATLFSCVYECNDKSETLGNIALVTGWHPH
jgi:hypothetical protein